MFKTRAISAVFLVIILGIVVWTGSVVMLLFLFGISMVAFYELMNAMSVHKKGTVSGPEIIGYISIAAWYCMLFLNFEDAAVWLICSALLLLAVYVFTFPKYKADEVIRVLFSVIYAPFMLSYIYRVRSLNQGIWLVLLIFVASWISDTCAYIFGMLLGKHKLAPKLSPKKSIEGSVGGIIGAALVGALLGRLMCTYCAADVSFVWICALIGGVGSIVSQIGDLAASGIKRNFDIKDYGKLIPGHGGIMDRFDSVIVTAPIIYYLCIYLLKL